MFGDTLLKKIERLRARMGYPKIKYWKLLILHKNPLKFGYTPLSNTKYF